LKVHQFIPGDHEACSVLLRSIDRHLNFDDVRQALKPFYSSTGRPSTDPELIIRMLIVAPSEIVSLLGPCPGQQELLTSATSSHA
jgi:hypothetical protein